MDMIVFVADTHMRHHTGDYLAVGAAVSPDYEFYGEMFSNGENSIRWSPSRRTTLIKPKADVIKGMVDWLEQAIREDGRDIDRIIVYSNSPTSQLIFQEILLGFSTIVVNDHEVKVESFDIRSIHWVVKRYWKTVIKAVEETDDSASYPGMWALRDAVYLMRIFSLGKMLQLFEKMTPDQIAEMVDRELEKAKELVEKQEAAKLAQRSVETFDTTDIHQGGE